jgi:hypothetical protein
MTERVLVAFEGDGAGIEELTWGQHHIWLEMSKTGSSLSMGATRVLSEAATLDELTEELRFYMCRYAAMRTRLLLAEGQPPKQVVAGAGEVAVEIVEAGDEDPATVAEAVANRDRERLFDYADEWPVRMVVVRRHGVPTHMVMTFCHMVTDAAGGMVMFNDYMGRDPVTGRARSPVAIQPAELARRQRTDAERRRSEVSLRYWEDLIRTIPLRRFAEPAGKPDTRYWQCWFSSPAMRLALGATAERTGADTSTVLLAAFSRAMVQVTGNDPAVMRLVASNRFRPGFTDVVAPMSQFGLCAIEAAGPSFDDVVRRTRGRAMSANKHAYYDMHALGQLLETVARDRGGEVDLSVYFNDRRMQQQLPAEPPDEEALRASRGLTSLRWERQNRLIGPGLMLHVNDAEDAVVIFAEVDAHRVSHGDVEAILRGMESLVADRAVAVA